MRHEFDRNAEFFAIAVPNSTVTLTVLAGCFVLGRVERRRRRRDSDRDTQFSSWSKFFHHVCLGRHNEAGDKRDDKTESEAIGDWH